MTRVVLRAEPTGVPGETDEHSRAID